MPQQYRAEDLNDPIAGDPISAQQARLQNELLRRSLSLPNSCSDSSGTRMVIRRKSKAATGIQIEITHIDDAARSFTMATYGVCIGKIITYDESEDWAVQYPGTLIEDGDEVFIGFVSQCRAGVPGQRYCGVRQGTKTCGDLTLPFVLVDGGAPTVAVLAEDHPGCGTVFEVWVDPAWNPSSHEWDLTACDGSTKYKAIDLRVWGLDPLKYATGLFVPRVSLTHGIILEVIELDCESPGGCYFCEAPA